jgi:tetratricopeptide (TPR) repeat protein
LSQLAWNSLRDERDPSAFRAASSLGRLHLAQGQVDDATLWLRRALARTPRGTDAQVMLGLGLAAFISRDDVLAATRLRSAEAAVTRCEDPALALRARGYRAWVEAGSSALAAEELCRVVDAAWRAQRIEEALRLEALAASIDARSGAIASAQRRVSSACVAAADWPDAMPLLQLAQAFIDLATARRDQDQMAARSAERSLLASGGPWGRFAVDHVVLSAFLRRSLQEPVAAAGEAVALVSEDGAWFRMPGGEPVDCRRRPVLRRLVVALARHRLERPGRPIPAQELFAAGWPDQHIREASAKNRLKVAISTLRKMGFGPALIGDRSGYRVDPRLSVRLTSP